MMDREEIYYADLLLVGESEQDVYRPVVVLQNNKVNSYYCMISFRLTKNPLPTHVMFESGLLEK